jgi:hypothetical protein
MEVVDVKRFEFAIDCLNAERELCCTAEVRRCVYDVAALRLLDAYRPLFDTLDHIDRLLSCVYWRVGCDPYAPVGLNRALQVRETTSAEQQKGEWE